jgi:hypothetical protein
MRHHISNLYNQLWTSLKKYSSNLLKVIRKNDKDDNHFNNPFVIY